MKTLERRAYILTGLEIRAGDGGKKMIAGHAAVFNQLSVDLGGFKERVAPGAFAKSLSGDVRALMNHDSNIVLGRTTNSTLRLKEDEAGLAVEIDPPDTQGGRDTVTLVERRDISQMSFAFRTLKDDWLNTGDEIIRTLIEVELFDVSPVTFAAYPQTDVAVRAFEAWTKATAAVPDLGPMRRELLRKKLAAAL